MFELITNNRLDCNHLETMLRKIVSENVNSDAGEQDILIKLPDSVIHSNEIIIFPFSHTFQLQIHTMFNIIAEKHFIGCQETRDTKQPFQ